MFTIFWSLTVANLRFTTQEPDPAAWGIDQDFVETLISKLLVNFAGIQGVRYHPVGNVEPTGILLN